MTEIVRLNKEHLERVSAPDVNFFLQGESFTIMVDGKIIALCGMLVLWEGVGTLWTIVLPEARQHKFAFHKTMKKLLEEHSKNLHRIQASVMNDDERSKKWIESLGFEKEGLHKMYDPDKNDHIGYAKIMPTPVYR